MKNKFTLLLVALAMVASASAKSSSDYNETGSKYGAEFGYSHNWLNTSSTLSITDTKLGTTDYKAKSVINVDGFYVGPTYTFLFSGVSGLYIKSGVVYQYNIGKIKSDDIKALLFNPVFNNPEVAALEKLSFVMHSLEVPVRIGYNYEFDNGVGINVFAGVSLNFGLDWKITGDNPNENAHAELHLISGRMDYEKNGYKSSKKDDTLKSYNIFDLGVGGGIGITYRWIYLNLGCDWGVTNLSKHASYKSTYNEFTAEYNNKAYNTQLKLGIGAKF